MIRQSTKEESYITQENFLSCLEYQNLMNELIIVFQDN